MVPVSRIAKSLVVLEVLLGIGWTVVVFAAALNALQQHSYAVSVPDVDNSESPHATKASSGS
jgi:hypothetical protein